MNRFTLFAVASLGLAACAIGCQSSGHAEASPDTTRPQMAEGTSTAERAAYTAPVDLAAYSVAYTTTADTPWMQASTDTTAAGTLRTGDVVYLPSNAPASGIVPAKTADNRIICVRASDLRRK